MSAFDVRFDVVRDTLTPGLAELIKAGGELAAPMAEISEAMFDHTTDRFAAEYGPDGVPWEIPQRVREEGGKILYLSGALFNALDRDSGDTFAQVGVQATGGPAIYARVHQEGATIRPRAGSGKSALRTPFGPRAIVTVPARPYLGIEVRDRSSAEQILFEHLGRAVAA